MRVTTSITAKALRICVLAAGRRGVPKEALLGPLGADPAWLDDADAQVPFEWIHRVWTDAPRLTGDPAFGLHAAEITAPLHAHVLDYVVAHCPRPRDVFEAVQRYQRLLMSLADLRLSVAGGVATFSHFPEAIPEGERPSQLADFVVAQWVLRVRARSERGFPLRRVMLQHEAPASDREYARIFQAPVEFGQDRDAIEFDEGLLDIELQGADATLVALLRRHADALLSRTPEPTSATDALRRHLLQIPPSTVPEVDGSARALGMSERTLQRRLGDEGTSFKAVLDGVRRDLSLLYLRDPRHSISDVAFLVGFSEVSAFSRAFRRWTRESPAGFRRAHAALAPEAKSLAAAGKTAEDPRR
jgi:AraC-like DNA-binding protein